MGIRPAGIDERREVLDTAFLTEISGARTHQYEKVTLKVNEAGSPAGCMIRSGAPSGAGILELLVRESGAALAFSSPNLPSLMARAR